MIRFPLCSFESWAYGFPSCLLSLLFHSLLAELVPDSARPLHPPAASLAELAFRCLRSTRHAAGFRFVFFRGPLSSSFRCSSAAHLHCCVLQRVLLCCSPRRLSACPAGVSTAISIVICPGPAVGLCRLRPGRPPGPSSRAGSPLPHRPSVLCHCQ